MAKIVPILGAIGAGAAAAVGVTVAATTVTAIVIGGAILVGGAIAIASVAKKAMMPDMPDFDTQGSQGILVNRTGSSVSIPVVYGDTRVGGVQVYINASGETGSGDDLVDNAFLHLAFALAEGECHQLSKVFFDGVEVGSTSTTGDTNPVNWTFTGDYSDKVEMYFRKGSDNQSEISQLAGEESVWDPRFRGIAYAYLRLEYDSEVWKNGLPTITFQLKGKKVPTISASPSYSFSDDPARCILDYLTNSRYGKGIDINDIDLTSFSSASTYYSSKGFHCRGNLDTNANMYVNLIDLFTCCRSFLAFGNKYRLIPDKINSTVSLTLDDSNTIGNVTYGMGDKSQLLNSMKAKFMDEATEYRDNIKIVSSSTLKTNDNGLTLEQEISLPYTKSASVAQQIITEEINQSRQSHVIDLTATIEAIDLLVGDVVQVTNSTFGITNKLFKVLSTEIQPSNEVRLILREYDPDVYGSSIITDYKADN